MIDLEAQLRRAAADARSVTDALDVERDRVATLERARTSNTVEIADHRPGRGPSRFVVAAAAALVVVATVGVIVAVRSGDSRRHVTVTPSPTTDAVATLPSTTEGPSPATATPTTDPATSAAPSTTPLSTDVPTTTTELPSGVSPGGSVSYSAPPPMLPLRSLGSTQLAPRGGENWIDVAVGDKGIVVNQSWAGYVTRIGFDGETRDIPIDSAIGPIVYGPGEVVYGLHSGESIDDFGMLAVALDGDRAGTTVASTPLGWTAYTEIPIGSFGHGGSGIVDRVREINKTVFGYVDVNGQPLEWAEADPALLTAALDQTTISDSFGHVWTIAVDASPGGADTFDGPSPPAPTSNGDAVYWRYIGPDARPDLDFGLQTMPVVAALHPDGSVTWWSVPDGWEVVASDVWGTVLARLTGQKLDLALASFAGEEGQAPGPTGCLGGVSSHDAAHVFATAMLAARQSGSLDPVSKCLGEIPAAYTGAPPACWTDCAGATRTVAAGSLVAGEAVNPDGTTFVTASLPVTYRTASGYLDVLETWTMTPTDEGFVIDDFAIQEPPETRERALATVTEFFDALAANDWLAAAKLLDNGGGVELDQRADILQLDPEDFTPAGIAAALARWCGNGCDTAVPTIDELQFTGSFALTRNDQQIQISWFEGTYGIQGVPFR